MLKNGETVYNFSSKKPQVWKDNGIITLKHEIQEHKLYSPHPFTQRPQISTKPTLHNIRIISIYKQGLNQLEKPNIILISFKRPI